MKNKSGKYSGLWPWINALVLIIFLFSVFGNIACPLLWNDESHTVMNAKFTAQFGYPKVTDGKNVVYAYQVNPDGSYERFDEDIQASNLPIWAGYYWCIPAYWLAESVEGFWLKTLIYRCWFALTGLVGLFFLLKSALLLLEPKRKNGFIFGFLLFCTINVSLGLHLREVRYYSLMLLLSGLSIFLFCRLYFGMIKRIWMTRISLGIVIALMFYTFHPLFFIFSGFFGLWIMPGSAKRIFASKRPEVYSQIIREFGQISPLAISLFLVAPALDFFQPFAETNLNCISRVENGN